MSIIQNLIVLCKFVLQISLVTAILYNAYYYGKDKSLSVMIKACSPVAYKTGNIKGVMDWIIALCVIELPALILHSCLKVLNKLLRKIKFSADGVNRRKGITHTSI